MKTAHSLDCPPTGHVAANGYAGGGGVGGGVDVVGGGGESAGGSGEGGVGAETPGGGGGRHDDAVKRVQPLKARGLLASLEGGQQPQDPSLDFMTRWVPHASGVLAR